MLTKMEYEAIAVALTDRVKKDGNAISSVRVSVPPFISNIRILSFEPSDLLFFGACMVVTISC